MQYIKKVISENEEKFYKNSKKNQFLLDQQHQLF